jgi:hypothetical protein
MCDSHTNQLITQNYEWIYFLSITNSFLAGAHFADANSYFA